MRAAKWGLIWLAIVVVTVTVRPPLLGAVARRRARRALDRGQRGAVADHAVRPARAARPVAPARADGRDDRRRHDGARPRVARSGCRTRWRSRPGSSATIGIAFALLSWLVGDGMVLVVTAAGGAVIDARLRDYRARRAGRARLTRRGEVPSPRRGRDSIATWRTSTEQPPGHRRHGVSCPAGTFRMGAEDFYPEERPVHRVSVDAFRIDRAPVTVAQFRRFVKATGYVTVAERPPDPADYPDADPDLLVPGSLVFRPDPRAGRPARRVELVAVRPRGALGPARGAGQRHVPARKAPRRPRRARGRRGLRAWAGKALPTEAEWERAARGGLDGARTRGATRPSPAAAAMANFWQGEFPWRNELRDGFAGTSPVGSFAPERLRPARHDRQRVGVDRRLLHAAPSGRRGEGVLRAAQPARRRRRTRASRRTRPGAHIPRRVIKGGSHLCAANYCLRYRPAARQGEAVDTSTSHIGFRCVIRG